MNWIHDPISNLLGIVSSFCVVDTQCKCVGNETLVRDKNGKEHIVKKKKGKKDKTKSKKKSKK